MFTVAYMADNMLGKLMKNLEVAKKQDKLESPKVIIENQPEAFSPACTLICMSQVIQSIHVNKYNFLEGGQLLKWVDICACLSAERLAGHPCVTVSVDDLTFEREVELGQVLSLKAQVNRAFNTSMEVGVTVRCESFDQTEIKPICEAFMTFVALDSQGKKVVLPTLKCLSVDEKACFGLASERRKVRISHAKTMSTILKEYKLSPVRSPSPNRLSQNENKFFNDCIQGCNTKVESVELVLPQHANHHGNTFGGQIMAWMETVASISAGRAWHGIPILRSVDMVYFRGPSTVGDRIVLSSVVNNVFQNSLEVGVRVEAYRYDNGKIGARRHINSAFLTYEKRNRTSQSLPVFAPEPLDGLRRQKEAAARRKIRLDRRYILSVQRQERLSVKWSTANALYICYGNIKTLSNLANMPNWHVEADDGDIALSTREEDGVLCFRVSLKLNKNYNVEDVFDILKNPHKRAEWDPLTLTCKLVAKIGEEDSIYHTTMRGFDPNSKTTNDFVNLVSHRKPTSKSESYKVAIRSVTHDQVPITNDHSRTEIACAGFLIKHVDGICKEITYYNETNPKLVSYVTCDIAGLGDLHSHVYNCLVQYLSKNLATV